MTGVGMAGQKMTDISLLFVSVPSSCFSQDQRTIRLSCPCQSDLLSEIFFCLTWLRWYNGEPHGSSVPIEA